MIERDHALRIEPLLFVECVRSCSEIIRDGECVVHERTTRTEEHIGTVDRLARHVEHSWY